MSSTFWNDDTNDVTHLLNLSAPLELDTLQSSFLVKKPVFTLRE